MAAIRIIDDHLELANIGSNTHAQIDSHIANISNPHVVTKAQVGLGSVVDGAEINVQSDWNAVAGDALILNKPSDITDLSGHSVTELSDITGAGSGIVISGAERAKLGGIETGATADQTKADIDGLGLSHDSLADVSANDHHSELHSIVSHNDTSATGAQLNTLTDNSMADALHRHSELVASDGSPDPALSVDAAGRVGIGRASTGGMLDIEFGLGEAPLFEMVTSDTNAVRTGQILKHTTTGNMVDGLGVNFLFRIEDATSGAQTIAQLRATRDGADNEGRLDLQAGTAGDEKFVTIRSSGKVGIGTSTPGYKLHLVDATDTRIKIAVTTAGQGCGFDFENTADNQAWRVTGQSTLFKIRDHTNSLDKFIIETGATGDVYFNNIKNVGISTLSPGEKLHVGGGAVLLDNGHWYKTKLSGGAKVRNFGTGGDDIAYFGGIDAAQTEMRFRTAGTNKMTIVSNGRIGIGTITPATSAKLDITSTTGALLLTRMTTTQKNALTAVNGMILYDSTLNKFQGRQAGSWQNLI